MTVYYYWRPGGTRYINAYPDETTQEGKYLILFGERKITCRWERNASYQRTAQQRFAQRITKQEACRLLREYKLRDSVNLNVSLV